MDLHERLTTARPVAPLNPEPFAELKNQVHLKIITELGPQLSTITIDPVALRERVVADIRRNLSEEVGLARDQRERLTNEIANDILGYGPLE